MTIEAEDKIAEADTILDELELISGETEPKSSKTYITKWRPWYDKVLLGLLKGTKPSDLARKLGCHPTWVSKIWNSELGRKRLKELTDKIDLSEIKNRISNMTVKAAEIFEEILESEDPNLIELRARIAKDVFDRTGLKEAEKHEITHEAIYKGIREAIEETSSRIENK